MKRKKESLILAKMLKKIAPQIGAKIFIEPQWGVVGQIVFKNARKSYFRYNTLDLNPVGASDVAKDKDYAAYFMKKMGYPIPTSEAFYSAEWCETIGSKRNIDAAYRFAMKLGFPVFVKPNSGSQGVDVALVHTKAEFYKAMRRIFEHDKIALVQCPVIGNDYRIVVLDKKIISAYERIPLNIIGDGVSSILQLLKKKQRTFIAANRDTRLKLDDPRIAENLKHQKLTMHSVLASGQKIFLLDNANLSSGGDAIDVTDIIHPEFKKLAIKLTADMGLRLCGVDIIVEGDISEKPKRYWILEVNAAPGLDHYVKNGKPQEKLVEQMYLEILKAIEG